MAEFYSDAHRSLQDRFDTRRLADALHDNVMRSELAKMDKRFITASDFFFLSTVDHNGFPTVSYKGGHPGFVSILDDKTIAFPVYDGNGMFYSMGNIENMPKVGMLFIDFERPRRLRLHGRAVLSADDPLKADCAGALMIVRIELESIFTNCPRYIHKYRRVESSEFVPVEGKEPPVPEWKRVDYLQENLPARDREIARQSGEVVTESEYRKNFWKGL
ncbi:pyridoxamine 5'-phosphate oxidase family protein [Primorskyibacter aestuariivivens]|uniref:pyridoxamine 5'-phosphate oxidase family protein n=1 Tax=Primorskyibacter aestuariivivens TaxID=1888912 RepID=UPI002301589F|nr:pyridoxamine 5'-phosphate oxidase family protein [Primorskyibacter aestuariivivens]MDA7430310.1 pyridoxamine 5'-phosphate oxidase family protein [Primorskyibacter aestuariivivens]